MYTISLQILIRVGFSNLQLNREHVGCEFCVQNEFRYNRKVRRRKGLRDTVCMYSMYVCMYVCNNVSMCKVVFKVGYKFVIRMGMIWCLFYTRKCSFIYVCMYVRMEK